MKVAVCLSGQLREFENSNILNKVINPNSADVFLHTWYQDDDIGNEFSCNPKPCMSRQYLAKDADKRVLDMYSPREYKIERPIDFTKLYDFNKYNDKKNKGIKGMNNNLSMLHSMKVANDLSKVDKYDCVIRARFDLKFSKRLIVDKFDMDVVNLFRTSILKLKKGKCYDWFAFSSSKVMDVYCSLFDEWDTTHDAVGFIAPGWQLTHLIDSSGIKYKAHGKPGEYVEIMR